MSSLHSPRARCAQRHCPLPDSCKDSVCVAYLKSRSNTHKRITHSHTFKHTRAQVYLEGLKEGFCIAERAILFVVGFEFNIGDPYPHVAKQLRALGLSDETDRNAKIEVQQLAWNLLRDRCGTHLSWGGC